jgi:DUF971 family protein
MTNIPHATDASWLATVLDGGRHLVLSTGDVRLRPIAADTLWTECPSAQGRRRRMDRPDLTAPPGIRIVRVSPIGHYAINIAFSDGHDRGVYPWSLLADLSRRPTMMDFLTAET